MAKIKIPISKSARQYGYVIWPPQLNKKMESFLDGAPKVRLVFMGADLGEKNVDWKYRRISVGYRWTRRLSNDISEFVLAITDSNEKKLIIECQ